MSVPRLYETTRPIKSGLESPQQEARFFSRRGLKSQNTPRVQTDSDPMVPTLRPSLVHVAEPKTTSLYKRKPTFFEAKEREITAAKLRPARIKQDKEQLYEDTLSLKMENNGLRSENMRLRTRLNQLEKDLTRKDEFLEELRGLSEEKQFSSVLAHSHLVAGLKQANKDLRTELSNKEIEFEKLKRITKVTKLQELETELKVYVEECQRLKDCIIEEAQAARPRDEARNFEVENVELEAAVAEAQGESERLKRRVTDLETQLRAQADSFQRQLQTSAATQEEKLQEAQAAKEAAVKAYADEMESLHRERVAEQAEAKKTQALLFQAQSDLADALDKARFFETDVGELREDKDKLLQQVSTLSADFQEKADFLRFTLLKLLKRKLQRAGVSPQSALRDAGDISIVELKARLRANGVNMKSWQLQGLAVRSGISVPALLQELAGVEVKAVRKLKETEPRPKPTLEFETCEIAAVSAQEKKHRKKSMNSSHSGSLSEKDAFATLTPARMPAHAEERKTDLFRTEQDMMLSKDVRSCESPDHLPSDHENQLSGLGPPRSDLSDQLVEEKQSSIPRKDSSDSSKRSSKKSHSKKSSDSHSKKSSDSSRKSSIDEYSPSLFAPQTATAENPLDGFQATLERPPEELADTKLEAPQMLPKETFSDINDRSLQPVTPPQLEQLPDDTSLDIGVDPDFKPHSDGPSLEHQAKQEAAFTPPQEEAVDELPPVENPALASEPSIPQESEQTPEDKRRESPPPEEDFSPEPIVHKEEIEEPQVAASPRETGEVALPSSHSEPRIDEVEPPQIVEEVKADINAQEADAPVEEPSEPSSKPIEEAKGPESLEFPEPPEAVPESTGKSPDKEGETIKESQEAARVSTPLEKSVEEVPEVVKAPETFEEAPEAPMVFEPVVEDHEERKVPETVEAVPEAVEEVIEETAKAVPETVAEVIEETVMAVPEGVAEATEETGQVSEFAAPIPEETKVAEQPRTAPIETERLKKILVRVKLSLMANEVTRSQLPDLVSSKGSGPVSVESLQALLSASPFELQSDAFKFAEFLVSQKSMHDWRSVSAALDSVLLPWEPIKNAQATVRSQQLRQIFAQLPADFTVEAQKAEVTEDCLELSSFEDLLEQYSLRLDNALREYVEVLSFADTRQPGLIPYRRLLQAFTRQPQEVESSALEIAWTFSGDAQEALAKQCALLLSTRLMEKHMSLREAFSAKLKETLSLSDLEKGLATLSMQEVVGEQSAALAASVQSAEGAISVSKLEALLLHYGVPPTSRRESEHN